VSGFCPSSSIFRAPLGARISLASRSEGLSLEKCNLHLVVCSAFLSFLRGRRMPVGDVFIKRIINFCHCHSLGIKQEGSWKEVSSPVEGGVCPPCFCERFDHTFFAPRINHWCATHVCFSLVSETAPLLTGFLWVFFVSCTLCSPEGGGRRALG
jgi:hypothetical protein